MFAEVLWNDIALSFLALLLEGVPFIIIGALISGLIDAFVPATAVARILPKQAWAAVLVAGLLGMVMPLCECAAIPVIRRMLRKGLPISSALTYMIAAPVVSPIVWFSTYKAFLFLQGGMYFAGEGRPPLAQEFATYRLLLGYAVAVLAGLVVLRLKPSWILRPKVLADALLGQGAMLRMVGAGGGRDGVVDGAGKGDLEGAGDGGDGGKERAGAGMSEQDMRRRARQLGAENALRSQDRWAYAMRAGMRDFLEVGVFFVIGVGLTSVLQVGVDLQSWQRFNESPLMAVVAMQGLAFVLGLCSTSDAFVAAQLNVDLGARMAFLVFGPMFDLKLVPLYLTVFRGRFVTGMGAGLFVLVMLICLYWWHMVAPQVVS